MGILVTDGILPSGIPISNVYMSFSGSVMYVEPKREDTYHVRAICKAFKDSSTKPVNPDITFSVETQVTNIDSGVYSILYAQLKDMFPNSIDVL
jgi:hypothetical protein